MEMDLIRLSRTVSYALRHHPEQYDLKLDAEGWTSVEVLLQALRRQRSEWKHLCEADLVEMMNRSDKQRFELRDGKIRALYGHSLQMKFAKVAVKPPDILFHGTSPKAVDIIRREGLKPMGRQYVHLSVDEPTARTVGRRRTKQPVVLRILAAEAHRNGVKFYHGNETVWLADYIPPEFIGE
jgi:putative RNA 2'-phosphotransferase